MAFLVLTTTASAAAPKSIVNTVGDTAAGATGGLFSAPRGVAVNQTGAGLPPGSAGTFYVVDTNNKRVQRFTPTGGFVSAWGWRVGKEGAEQFELCTDAEECKTGLAGSNAGQFGNNNAQGIAVDQASGNIYVSDQSGANRRINIFSSEGSFQGAFGWGVINGANAFQFCTTASGCASPNIGAGGEGGKFSTAIGGLAVDGAGRVYVANKAFRRIDVFKPILSGSTVTGMEFLRAFGRDVVIAGKANDVSTEAFEVCDATTGNVPADCKAGSLGNGLGHFGGTNTSPADVAIDSAGNIFALDLANKRIQKFSPASVPLEQEFGAAALSAIFGNGVVPNTTGEILNLAIDRSNDHVFVSGKRSTDGNKLAVAELDHLGLNAVQGGGAHGLDVSSVTSTGLAVAESSLGGSVYLSSPSTGVLQGVYILNALPVVTAVTNITGTSATFEGEVVSDGIGVTYHFEYSKDGKTWARVPVPDADAGAGPGRIPVEVDVSDLTGSQPYRVRLVQNRASGGGQATSAEVMFTTGAAAPGILGTVASPVRDTSATFNAYLDPQNQPTAYHFEYGTGDCSVGSCTALAAAEAKGGGPRLITQTATGLKPSTIYHYRLIATNASGETKSLDGAFETFAPGARLPDDRAYELVTPPDTGAVVLQGAFFGEDEGRSCFDTYAVTADSVLSQSRGGSLPGLSVNGKFDLFESVRGPGGWTTGARSASGAQTTNPSGGGCASPDHRYSTMLTGSAPNDVGTLVIEGKQSNYIRLPEAGANPACSPADPGGYFELAGCGALGFDPEANVRGLANQGSHVLFTSKKQLELDAPPSGTEAVYDRTPGGATGVVSLLPGDVPLGAGQDASYQGASPDGSNVAFKVGGALYLRKAGSETLAVAAAPNTFAGVSSDGRSVFYANAALSLSSDPAPAALFAYDAVAEAPVEIASNSVFVNVSEDGSHVYFTSKSVFTGPEQNAQGEEAEAGEDNLYVWSRASEAIEFVAVLAAEDVSGNPSLSRWVSGPARPDPSVGSGRADDPSRTTPDGSVLVFESQANLTGFDSQGHVEIYRYLVGGGMDCVSCPVRSGRPPESDASLQAFAGTGGPASPLVHVQNVTDDGQQVFFQTEDALVPTDVNGTWDVYEWKAGQQAYLISSGHGQLPSFLYGMTSDGSDVFFTSTERLVPQDLSSVSSIYDARIGGGFPFTPAKAPCDGDTCQGPAGTAPALAGAGSGSFQGPENERPRRTCRKNTRRVTRNGKTRCVKRHRSKGGKRQAKASQTRRADR